MEVMAKYKIRRGHGQPDVLPRNVCEVDDQKKGASGKTEYEELKEAGGIVDLKDATRLMRMSEREVKAAVEEYRNKKKSMEKVETTPKGEPKVPPKP